MKKFRVYSLEKRDLDLGNPVYADTRIKYTCAPFVFRLFLEEVDESPFNSPDQAEDFCRSNADKNNMYTMLPVFGG